MGKANDEDKPEARKQQALDGIGTAIMDALLNEGCTMDEVIGVIDKELRDYDGLRERLTSSAILKFPGRAAAPTPITKKRRGKKMTKKKPKAVKNTAAKKRAPRPKPKAKKAPGKPTRKQLDKVQADMNADFEKSGFPYRAGKIEVVGNHALIPKVDKPKMSVEERMQKMRDAKAAKRELREDLKNVDPPRAKEITAMYIVKQDVKERKALNRAKGGRSKESLELEESIIKSIPTGHRTNSSLCAHLGIVSPFVMKMALNHLKSEGRIRMEGQRSTSKYYLSEEKTETPNATGTMSYPEVMSKDDLEKAVGNAFRAGEMSLDCVCAYIWGQVPVEGSFYYTEVKAAYDKLKNHIKPEPESPRREAAPKLPPKPRGDNAMLHEQKLDMDEVRKMCDDISKTTALITADSAKPYKLGMPPEKFLELMDDVQFQSRVELDVGYDFMVNNDDGKTTVQIIGKRGE